MRSRNKMIAMSFFCFLAMVAFSLRTVAQESGAVPGLTGEYLGFEGDDRIGLVVDAPVDGIYPVTVYEDGLPGSGHLLHKDDRYVGTAAVEGEKLAITLNRKFDGRKEKPVEPELRQLSASVIREGAKVTLTIPGNREWDRIEVVKTATADDAKPKAAVPPAVSPESLLEGRYEGFEGDDRIGVEIGRKSNGVFPVTIYEEGLPGKGHDPDDDDRYVGSAVWSEGRLNITIERKFDGRKEKRVDPELRRLTATVQIRKGKIVLSIPRNREWDDVEVSRNLPATERIEPKTESPSESELTGRYLGFEGDDRIGVEIGVFGEGVFPVTIYEDGLPNDGHFLHKDDRYVGTATFRNGNLEIDLTQKFDGRREKPVEPELRRLSATVSQSNGAVVLTLPKNREWDRIEVRKIP